MHVDVGFDAEHVSRVAYKKVSRKSDGQTLLILLTDLQQLSI